MVRKKRKTCVALADATVNDVRISSRAVNIAAHKKKKKNNYTATKIRSAARSVASRKRPLGMIPAAPEEEDLL